MLLPAELRFIWAPLSANPPAQEWSARRPAVASLVFVLVRAARDAALFCRVYELLAALCTLLSLDELPLHSCQLPLSAAVPDRIRQCLAGGLRNTSSRCFVIWTYCCSGGPAHTKPHGTHDRPCACACCHGKVLGRTLAAVNRRPPCLGAPAAAQPEPYLSPEELREFQAAVPTRHEQRLSEGFSRRWRHS